jgi:hypothetical protein
MAESKGVSVEQVREYVQLEAKIEELAARWDEMRARLIAETLKRGSVPQRATKTTVLEVEEAYQLTVTRGQQIEVDPLIAEDICAEYGQAIFRKIFREVTKYAVAKTAKRFLANKKVSPRLLRMYARAVGVKEKKPSLRVVDLEAEKKEAA